MAKYIIDVPDKWVDITNGLHIQIETGWDTGDFRIDTGLKLTPYTEPDRKDIEDEVWEFVRNLIHPCNGGLYTTEKKEIFDRCSSDSVLIGMSYQEAKAKYEAWKADKDKICVGDEVVVNGTRAVVMKLDETGNIDRYFTSNGTTFGNISGFQNYEVTKTNRHFPEVAELLKKMREESDD